MKADKKSLVLSHIKFTDFFSLLQQSLEFCLVNQTAALKKFAREKLTKLPMIENHLKEVSLHEKLVWRRLNAYCLYSLGEFKRCFKYVIKYLVWTEVGNSSNWTWELMALLYN